MNTREEILSIIEKNSRIDVHELSVLLGAEEVLVANELKALEDEGVICGYHSMIDWSKTNIEKVNALIEVKVTPTRGQGFDNIAERIEKAKLFVLSSNFEGMPNALMEAMALGIPCVSTDCPCGGPSFLIKNNKNGFLVRVNNKEDLKNTIKCVLKKEKDELDVISKNAKETASELTEEKINNIWYTYINNILNKSK